VDGRGGEEEEDCEGDVGDDFGECEYGGGC
jgi:hypothetical protein